MRRQRPAALIVAAGIALAALLLVPPVATATPAQEQELVPREPAAEGEARAQEPESGEHGPEGAEGQEHGAEAEHGEAEHHGPTWTEYLFRWINFALLGALLWWLLVVPPSFVIENFEFPGLRVVLRERAEGILAAKELAEEQREEADERLAESRERLDKVEQEAQALVTEAREDSERERQRLEEDGVEQAARIRAAADRDLRSETARARRELRVFAADLAVELAADLVREHLTAEDQRRLVDDYLDDLGRRIA